MKKFFAHISTSEIRNTLAVIIVLGCFILLYLMMTIEVPKENKDLLYMAAGFVFGGALAGVIGYFFGASKSDNHNVDTKTEITK